jgi:site-specific DNA-methyltransferase (adenine-specific)
MRQEVIIGDCVNEMRKMADGSIDMVLTSPPYDNLRKYNGYSFDFEETARQIHRIMKDGGVMVWVVGDATIDGDESGTSFRQALYFKEIGFRLHDTMIYRKEVPTWNRTSMRYRQNFEYMFVMSKGKVATFNPIEDQQVKNMKPRMCKSNRNGIPKYELYTPKKTHTCRGNIWNYAVGGKSTGHPAVFPEKLAHDHIISWSNEGDVVLDPFAGSGTTLKVAKELGRGYVGIEVSEEYVKIINDRIK